MTRYERLEQRAFKAFHRRAGKNGESNAARKANIIYWKAAEKGWFNTPEKRDILLRLSTCLDCISNLERAPENVYMLFAEVREM